MTALCQPPYKKQKTGRVQRTADCVVDDLIDFQYEIECIMNAYPMHGIEYESHYHSHPSS